MTGLHQVQSSEHDRAAVDDLTADRDIRMGVIKILFWKIGDRYIIRKLMVAIVTEDSKRQYKNFTHAGPYPHCSSERKEKR